MGSMPVAMSAAPAAIAPVNNTGKKP